MTQIFKMFFACVCFCVINANAFAFEELKGDHFIVYHTAHVSEARQLLSRAEGYYDSIADMLGYSRYDNFWTWDNRCTIYLYETQDAYAQATGAYAWAGGHANLKTRTIYSYLGKENFLESTLPHEIAHLIFRDHVGLDIGAALWLHEGVAMSAETLRREQLYALGVKALSANTYIPFEELARVHSIPPTISSNAVALFYAEALLAVDFLLTQYTSDRFVLFCRDIRDGFSVNDALRRGYARYGVSTLSDLESKVKMHYA